MNISAPAIRIDGLTKTFRKYASPRARLVSALFGVKNYTPFHALKGLNITIKRGETVAIIGKNGSGKSTLLQILAGTLSPSGGSIEVNGRVAALLELGAGFNPEFTGRENVFLNAAILGLSQAETEARLPDILAFAEIGEAVDAPVKTYSSGMFMRLAFSVAAHVDADILIVDEALSVGDAFFVQKCMRYLRQFQKRGTVLFVSHDTNAVLGLCDRAIWLDSGEIRASGVAREVCEAYLAAYYHGGSMTLHPEFTTQGDSSAQPQNDSTHKNRHPERAKRVEGTHATQGDSSVKPQNDSISSPTLRGYPLAEASAACPIEVFDFNPHSDGFGVGGGYVSAVRLVKADNSVMLHPEFASSALPQNDSAHKNCHPERAKRVEGTHATQEDSSVKPQNDKTSISTLQGGEAVTLEVEVKAEEAIERPIIGFFVKDRLGQPLFGENTFVAGCDAEPIPAGEHGVARFTFIMPLLVTGDYAITVALADGTAEEHIQRHWLHDALTFNVQAAPFHHGIMGIPMQRVEFFREV